MRIAGTPGRRALVGIAVTHRARDGPRFPVGREVGLADCQGFAFLVLLDQETDPRSAGRCVRAWRCGMVQGEPARPSTVGGQPSSLE